MPGISPEMMLLLKIQEVRSQQHQDEVVRSSRMIYRLCASAAIASRLWRLLIADSFDHCNTLSLFRVRRSVVHETRTEGARGRVTGTRPRDRGPRDRDTHIRFSGASGLR